MRAEMKKGTLKILSLFCLCIWMFVQLPAALFHHHDAHCGQENHNDIGEKRFHEHEEDDCFCCALLFSKSARLANFDYSIIAPHFVSVIFQGNTFFFNSYFGQIKGRSPPQNN
ncbi:MAG: hypothetical protein H0X62_01375 [Bacteroidetes bacterium]|nr:hypothetical protein [Bacteroidota bacterium]